MNEKIVENSGVKFFANTELEKWRAETLLQKEPETIAWLDHYSNIGHVFYDIGANVGSYSIYAASRNQSLNVYAFEPVQENYSALLNNISLNNANNIHSFRIAASNKNGLAQIFLQDCRVGNSGAQIDEPIDERGNRFNQVSTQKVLSLSLNSLVNELHFPAPNFIKIDVDGHENRIIQGMDELLVNESLQSILIEFNSSSEIDHYSKLMKEFGFAPDELFNNHPEHSSIRRSQKSGTAVNCVFSRK